MAVVQDYYTPQGCHIVIHDDFYRDNTPEENKARFDRAAQIVLREEFRKYVESMGKDKKEPE